jgi:hypothetical protein
LAAARRAEDEARAAFDRAVDQQSRQALAAARPAHQAAVSRIARAIAELSAASAAEARLRRDLQEGGAVGVETALPSMAYPERLLGDWRVYGTPAAIWLETARRLGFVGASEDPERANG